MEPLKVIQKYYNSRSKAYSLLIAHSIKVTEKSIKTAQKVKHLKPNLKFIEEAAMLHDIGIFLTYAPEIRCFGKKPYICHGYLGREILEKEGLLSHALVCERHIGVGLTKKEIEKQKLPLPRRDMIPLSLEEKIICFSDKFFSKNKKEMHKEKDVKDIKRNLLRFGIDKVKTFEKWLAIFDN